MTSLLKQYEDINLGRIRLYDHPVAGKDQYNVIDFMTFVNRNRQLITEGNPIINSQGFFGFNEDYIILQFLIKKYQPTSFMEIGTSSGEGTQIITSHVKGQVYSIDLPNDLELIKSIYPSDSPEDWRTPNVGQACRNPYKQVFGNSISFDYSSLAPVIEGWFIDGKHSYEYVTQDALNAIRMQANLIVFHDLHVEGVSRAIIDVFKNYPKYQIWHVEGTRIGFAIPLNTVSQKKNWLGID